VQAVSKAGEQIAYGYDGSLVVSQALTGTLNQTLSYTYNNDFNLTGFTYAGAAAAYTYDDDGLLTQASGYTITNNAQNGLPEGVNDAVMGLSRSFNGYGEVSGQSVTVNGAAAGSWALTHNNNGQIITKTETVAGVTADYAYSYDEVGRLREVEKDGVLVEEYQYNNADPLGVRTYEMNVLRGIAGRSLTYNIEDQLLTVGSAVYQYNLDGFLRVKVDGADSTVYDYSSRGELLSVNLPFGDVVEYVHDPLGRRIAKKVNGATVEKYLWSGLTRLLAVYDGANNLLMRFEYADARMPVAMTQGGNKYYLVYDQVGSLRAVTDSTGTVIKRVDYDTFGNILADTNAGFPVPFGFAGGLHDRDTELVRFGVRDYDPSVGRWTAKDPIGFAGGDDDLYGYTLDDPVNWVDPWGFRPCRDPLTAENILSAFDDAWDDSFGYPPWEKDPMYDPYKGPFNATYREQSGWIICDPKTGELRIEPGPVGSPSEAGTPYRPVPANAIGYYHTHPLNSPPSGFDLAGIPRNIRGYIITRNRIYSYGYDTYRRGKEYDLFIER
jgi:RHS repeat-associated protein